MLPILFKEFIDYSVLERCLEPTTIRWYENSIKSFYKYLRYKVLSADLDNFTTETLRAFFISQRQLGNSPRTILNFMVAIRAFATFLIKRNYLKFNPFDKLERPKLSKRLPIFLDENETRELLRACIDKKESKCKKFRDIAIVSLFIFTGIRRKELLNLKLQDVNLERNYIKVFAKNKERIVPLNETCKQFLIDYLKVRPKREIDYVFVSMHKKYSPLTEQGLADVFVGLRKIIKFNKPVSPQILRHTCLTLLLRNGVNLRDIQLIAGHSDISTTASYYLGTDDKQLKIAVDKHPLNI